MPREERLNVKRSSLSKKFYELHFVLRRSLKYYNREPRLGRLFWCNFPGKQSSSSGPLAHDTASKPDGDSRTDRYLHSSCDGYGPFELSVEEERHSYRWGELIELHDAGHDKFRQWGTVHGGGQQHGGECDQQRSHAHGERKFGGAHDHNTASEPDSDGRSDCHVRGSGDGYGTVELPVEEERHGHLWGDLFELYHASYDKFRQRSTVHGGGQQHGGKCDQQCSHPHGEFGLHPPKRSYRAFRVGSLFFGDRSELDSVHGQCWSYRVSG